MKWSEIFRKNGPLESSSVGAHADAPEPKKRESLPPFKDARDEEISDEKELGEAKNSPPRVPLPESYFYPDNTEAAHLHAELLRELPADHPLFGVPLETFVACHANDDTLFRFRGNPRRFVLVHLTGLGRTEINADYPSIVLSGSFDDFLSYATEVHGLISKRDLTE